MTPEQIAELERLRAAANKLYPHIDRESLYKLADKESA